MSTSYWAVDGYGWKIDTKLIDPVKYVTLAKYEQSVVDDIKEINSLDNFICNCDLSDEFYCIIQSVLGDKRYADFIGVSTTGNADMGEYLLINSGAPWQITELEKETLHSKEAANELLLKIIRPILKDDVKDENIELDYVSTYGCG